MIFPNLTLPLGYQDFSYFSQGTNPRGIFLNRTDNIKQWFETWDDGMGDEAYVYTQHQIFLEEGIIKHTRTSPNWEGGMVTFSTCKHRMRSVKKKSSDGRLGSAKSWVGTWIVGLCPAYLASNTVLFIGQVLMEFPSNYDMGRFILDKHIDVYAKKDAMHNPRGDLYEPKGLKLDDRQKHSHYFFEEPPNHTRSVEFYKKSPGSISNRKDKLIPKWWRDIEYVTPGGVRPPSFIFSPCWLFSKPMVWTSKKPGRACLRMSTEEFSKSLRFSE